MAAQGVGVVHFKFRNALSYDSVSFDGHYVSAGELKRRLRAAGVDASGVFEKDELVRLLLRQ